MTQVPEISVVIPCLNEEEAVGAVVDQALEGIRRSGRTGEVIVVDNDSTDRSAEVAADARRARRARAAARLRQRLPRRPRRRTRASTSSWRDADETYPHRASSRRSSSASPPGDDLVMGSRFEGTIHGDAMPWLNRHVGNPILTGMLNLLFGVKVSDAHCGMRAVRSDALPVLDLHSTGMEFASEMVFKAYRRGLTVSEIPIDYYPRVGESKLNRFGDAWRHVNFMLLYSPSWLYFVPGLVLLLLGLIGTIALATGPVDDPRPHLADPHAVRVDRGGAPRHADRPARRLRAHVRARRTRRARSAARAARRTHPARARPDARRLALLARRARHRSASIFGAWAFDGFGTLAHEYATAIGFTLLALGIQVILGSFFLGLLTMRTGEPSRATHRLEPSTSA